MSDAPLDRSGTSAPGSASPAGRPTSSSPSPSAASQAGPIDGFAAVVPAGGTGTRLWPLSRAGAPKFLHDLTGTGRTLLQGTVDRMGPLCGAGRLLVVTGRAHEGAVRSQLPQLTGRDLVLEPSPRDSMAAIGLAAAVLARREGDDVVVGSFAADHLIADTPGEAPFAEVVRQAVVTARTGAVVTIGIAPTAPSTAFGYIEAGEPLAVPGAPLASRVTSFVEKPDAATADAYLASGRYRWNAGMFVARAGVLLEHLAQQAPTLAEGLARIADAWDTPARGEVLDATWSTLLRIAIDHAIAEPVAAAGGVAVVAGAFGWDDVGDWDSLTELLHRASAPASGAGPATDPVVVLGDASEVRAEQGSSGLVVSGAGRAISVVGIPDAVVVDTPDALLVTTRAHAQHLKEVVGGWRAAGRADLL